MAVPTPPFTVEQVLETDIFELLDLTDLSTEDRADMQDEMIFAIDSLVLSALEEECTPDQLERLEEGLEKEDGTILERIAREMALDFEEVYAAATMQHKVQLCQIRYGENAVVAS